MAIFVEHCFERTGRLMRRGRELLCLQTRPTDYFFASTSFRFWGGIVRGGSLVISGS
jgi:hypothetical protein